MIFNLPKLLFFIEKCFIFQYKPNCKVNCVKKIKNSLIDKFQIDLNISFFKLYFNSIAQVIIRAT